MRRKIIYFLYNNRLLRSMIPLFNRLIGHNRMRGRGITIQKTPAVLFHNQFCGNYGKNNKIVIGDSTHLEWSKITFKGNNNVVDIGKSAFLNGLDIIIEGDNNSILIGNNTFVKGDTRIYVVDGSTFKMGDGCMMSDRIEIRTTDNHSIINSTTGKRINYEKDVVIHDKVWIGTGVTLLKGTELAEGCIVGAASCVVGNHNEPHTIIVGNPARKIKDDVYWLMERI